MRNPVLESALLWWDHIFQRVHVPFISVGLFELLYCAGAVCKQRKLVRMPV